MPLFEWTQDLSVGNEVIDGDHQRLIDLINQFYDAIAEGSAVHAVARTLDELIRYTQEHFRREEVLMEKISYLDYPLHKQEHDKLMQEVTKMQADLVSGLRLPPISLANFLGVWLFKHIHGWDKKLAEAVVLRQRFMQR